MSEPLLLTREGAVAIVAINDAPYNRMSLDFMDQLENLVENIAGDDTIRAVVLTSEGLDHFSVAMNVKQLPEGIKQKGSAEAVFDQRLNVISKIENMGKPWVATLFGYCLGGGLELPLGCHFRLAAEEDAQIGLPEMDLGSVPAWGGSARLSRCVGSHHALDMILRAKKISGPEAPYWPRARSMAIERTQGARCCASPRPRGATCTCCAVHVERNSWFGGKVASYIAHSRAPSGNR